MGGSYGSVGLDKSAECAKPFYVGEGSLFTSQPDRACAQALRVFGIPDFRCYAVAEVIKDILTRFQRHDRPLTRDEPDTLILPLFVT
jgi:hypothetical protein